MRKIVLASASPRRKEILKLTGLKFIVCKSDYEEDLSLSLSPRKLARFLSLKKAEAVAHRYRNSIIIAADTFIVFQSEILGKPLNERAAVKMLSLLNGKSHSVITGFTIIDTFNSKILSRAVVTKVYFKKLSKQEIAVYVESKEPLGKAGAYAIQGLGSVFIDKIDGDFFNVMGLPLSALTQGLKEFGVYILKQSKKGQ